MKGKMPHEIFPLKFSFSIGYGIGPKYLPIWVLVSVLNLNQNSGFIRTLNIIDPFDNFQLD